MKYTKNDHVFVLCAHGKSPYLEECIQSLEKQTVNSHIYISTATPSDYIDEIANRYGLEVKINHGEDQIGNNWNFGYNAADKALITLAHEDDIYEPGYTESMLNMINRAKDPILYFCDYSEYRDGVKVSDNKNLRIKRFMLFPLRSKLLQRSRWVRRRILSLGNPICCPSVTYVASRIGKSPFSTEMKVSLDWDQWEKQSKKKGSFVYDPQSLMLHRIHEGSSTTELIKGKIRAEEDYEMFQRMWPRGIAKLLERWYSASEKSNKV